MTALTASYRKLLTKNQEPGTTNQTQLAYDLAGNRLTRSYGNTIITKQYGNGNKRKRHAKPLHAFDLLNRVRWFVVQGVGGIYDIYDFVV